MLRGYCRWTAVRIIPSRFGKSVAGIIKKRFGVMPGPFVLN